MARTRLVLHLVLALVVAMPALARADTEATSTILFVAFRGCEELCQGFKDRIAASGPDKARMWTMIKSVSNTGAVADTRAMLPVIAADPAAAARNLSGHDHADMGCDG